MTETAKIQVETNVLGPCLHQVAIQVPAARVAQEFTHYFAHAGRRVKLSGFRPGKVPLDVLRRHLGPEAEKEAREHLFEHLIADALRESGLQPLRILDFDPSKYEVDESSALDFGFQVETRPELELVPWDEVKVEPKPHEPDDEQVDGALEYLAREHVRFDEVEDQVVDDEHLAVCDLVYRRDGVDGPKAEGLQLSLGSPLYGTDPEGYEAALRGAQAGDERELPVQFNEGFSEEAWVGSEGTAFLQVRAIVKPRPASHEEVVEDLKLDSVDALRQRVTEQLRTDNEQRERERQVFEMLEQLGRLRPFDLPQRLVEEEIEATLAEHRERLEKQGGLSAEQAGQKAEEVREQVAEESRRRLSHYFLVRKVAEQDEIRVTRSDMESAFRSLAARHQVEPQAVQAYYEEQGLTSKLQSDILEGKVRSHLAGIAEKAVAGEEPAPPVVPASESE